MLSRNNKNLRGELQLASIVKTQINKTMFNRQISSQLSDES